MHQLAGELAAGLDEDDIAIAHFEQLLALAPAAALAPGTSPKIVARFDAARARATGRPALAAHAEADPAGAAVVIDADPLAMITGARARFRAGAPGEVVVRGTGRVVLPLPRDATAVELAAVDAHGNALWIGAPVATLAPPPPPPPRAHAWGGTTAWGVAAAGSLALAGISVWRLRTAEDEWSALRADDGHHDYSELAAVETRGRRWALAADVAFGAAATTGAIALIVGIRELGRGDRDARDDAAVRVAPVVTPGGLGVVLAARF
jgi:hypothetical protein